MLQNPWFTDKTLWAKIKPLAQEMRQEPTTAERHLWLQLRKRAMQGVKFRRQHTFDRFIVDFYAKSVRLVIEVDGPIHQYTPHEDTLRTEFLEGAFGLSVVRFTNDEVIHQMPIVLTTITRIIQIRRQETTLDE